MSKLNFPLRSESDDEGSCILDADGRMLVEAPGPEATWQDLEALTEAANRSAPPASCEGCGESAEDCATDGVPVETYVIEFSSDEDEGPGPSLETVGYCGDCAGLARANYSGTVARFIGKLGGPVEGTHPMQAPIPQERAEALHKAAGDLLDLVRTSLAPSAFGTPHNIRYLRRRADPLTAALSDAMIHLRVPAPQEDADAS
jgi:hypothetical protein